MIQASGLGSGLDIDSLVAGLVASEGDVARRRLVRQEAGLTAEISSFGQLSSTLLTLDSAAEALNSETSFQTQKVSASSWLELKPTLTGTDQASVGKYDITVSGLAESHSLVTPSTNTYASLDATVGTGTLSITLGTGSYATSSDNTYNSFTPNSGATSVDIVIDSSNSTLNGVKDAINEANAGVSASVLKDGENYRLLLTASNTGASNALSISVSNDGDGDNTDTSGLSALAFDGSTNSLIQTRRASDASFSVNGLDLSSATNKVSNVIDGVDLELLAVTSDASFEVVYDDSTMVKNVESFVAAYNDVASTIKSLTSYNAETGVAGSLQGESLPRTLMSALRTTLFSDINGLTGTLKNLGDIGIELQASGQISLNTASLTELLSSDRRHVSELFSGLSSSSSESDGVAGSFEGLIGSYIGDLGSITSKTESLNRQVASIEDEKTKLTERLESLEQRYYRQFNAMDALVAQLTNTGDFLLAQLDSMPAANREKK